MPEHRDGDRRHDDDPRGGTRVPRPGAAVIAQPTGAGQSRRRSGARPGPDLPGTVQEPGRVRRPAQPRLLVPRRHLHGRLQRRRLPNVPAGSKVEAMTTMTTTMTTDEGGKGVTRSASGPTPATAAAPVDPRRTSLAATRLRAGGRVRSTLRPAPQRRHRRRLAAQRALRRDSLSGRDNRRPQGRQRRRRLVVRPLAATRDRPPERAALSFSAISLSGYGAGGQSSCGSFHAARRRSRPTQPPERRSYNDRGSARRRRPRARVRSRLPCGRERLCSPSQTVRPDRLARLEAVAAQRQRVKSSATRAGRADGACAGGRYEEDRDRRDDETTRAVVASADILAHFITSSRSGSSLLTRAAKC